MHASSDSSPLFLSQALLLGYLSSPHSAFQEHAAHTTRWPVMLSSKGSSGTCIPEVLRHSSTPLITAHLLKVPVRPVIHLVCQDRLDATEPKNLLLRIELHHLVRGEQRTPHMLHRHRAAPHEAR